MTTTQTHGTTVKANIHIANVFDFNKDAQVAASDVTDIQTHGTTNETGLVFINIGAGEPFAPVSNTSGSVDTGVASALASTATTAPTTPAIPPWIVNRLSHLDLNHGPIAKYFEHLAHENTARSRAILVKTDQVSDGLNLDDTLLDSLLVKLGLE